MPDAADIIAFDLDSSYGCYDCISPTIFQGEVDSGAAINLYRDSEVCFSKTLPRHLSFHFPEIDANVTLAEDMEVKSIKYFIDEEGDDYDDHVLEVIMDNINSRIFELNDNMWLGYHMDRVEIILSPREIG